MGFFDKFMLSYGSEHNSEVKYCGDEFPFDEPIKENPIPTPPENLPKWITVIGYKVVNPDMKSFFGHYQFEMNKTHYCEGELSPCENGFHFCLTLKDACTLFVPRYGNRYFKVKALVPASNYYNEREGIWKSIPKSCYTLEKERARDPNSVFSSGNSIKYVAKEITFIEEIFYPEIKKYVDKLPYITEENYYNIMSHLDYKKLLIQKWHDCADSVFSELFVDYIFTEKIGAVEFNNKDKDMAIAKRLDKAIKIVNALRHEKISQEFKVMVFLNEFS